MGGLLHSLDAFFGLTSYGGVGILLLAALLLALRIFLPSQHRDGLRLPLALAVVHLVVVALRAAMPQGVAAAGPLATVAVLLLQLAFARSIFLLLFRSTLAARAQATPRIIQDIVQGVLYTGALLLTLQAAGVEPGSLLTTSALLTAVVGLSLQDTLGNLFAGLSIQAQVPFEVGDWISIDDNPRLIGCVIEINWRATKILTTDELEILIPNGTLAKASIRNFTKPTPVARRNVQFDCAYDVAPGRVREVVLAGLVGTPGVLEEPRASVVIERFSDSGITYTLYFYIDQFARKTSIEGEVRERVWYAFQRAGLPFPFPVRDVRMAAPAPSTPSASLADPLAVLRGVDVLAVLPDDALRRLSGLLDRRLYAHNELILRQGDPGDELFIIERGEVRILVGRQGGSSAELTRLGPGKFFGEMSLMTGERRTATVQAVNDCQLLVVRKDAFQQVLAMYPDLTVRISELLMTRQGQLDEHLAARSQKSQQAVLEQRDELLGRIRRFFSL